MAVTSGTVTTNVSGKSNFYVNWTQVSQSVANNQTTINWTAGLYTGTSRSHDIFYSNAVKIYNVYIDGVLVSNGGTWSNITTGGNHDLLSGTSVIQHSSDGTKSFNISISAWTYPSSNYSGNTWFQLTDIPRQATVTNATDFNDEQNPTIYYSNPAGNAVTSLQAYIENDVTGTGLIGLRDIPKTGSSYTFPLTAAERNTLRNAIPNSNSLRLRFAIRTNIGGNYYYSWVTKIMTIVNANPSISDIQYLDTNTDATDLTNDDQIIIQNFSTLQFQLYDINAYKGATLASFSVNINGNVKTTTYSGTSIASTTYNYNEVDVSNDTNAVVTIKDSRGNQRSYNVPLTVWPYFSPTAIINVSREDNFYTESIINVDANYADLNGLNTIDIKYRIKKSEDNTWDNWVSLSDNVEANFNADNQYAWDVQVTLEDILGAVNTYTINNALDVGTPLVFYDMKKRSVGVNCFPINDGTLEVNGADVSNTYSTNELIIGTWIDGKPIYRKVVDFGALPGNTQKGVNHGVQNIDIIINMYGFARRILSSGTPTYTWLPIQCNRPRSPADGIGAWVEDSTIQIATGNASRTAFTETYVILEYTKRSE